MPTVHLAIDICGCRHSARPERDGVSWPRRLRLPALLRRVPQRGPNERERDLVRRRQQADAACLSHGDERDRQVAHLPVGHTAAEKARRQGTADGGRVGGRGGVCGVQVRGDVGPVEAVHPRAGLP